MNNEDVLQRNAAGELEIRTAPSTGDTSTNKDDVYTRDAQGRLCVRTTGGGGGGGGTGTVTSVNGVQPVGGNVEITGDNITATVGEEEATITQHLTTLKNDESGLAEQVLGLQQSINGKQDALTTEQLAAVNSGITSAKVASYDAYAGEISTAQSTADKADNAAEVAQQTANLAGQEAAQALEDLKSKANTSDLPQNQTGTVGQVYTKTESGAAWQDASGGEVFPKESDFIPVTYSGSDQTLYGGLSINLGALADGVYEFYVRTKSRDAFANFTQHYYRITIANGEIDYQYPNTYITVAFTPNYSGVSTAYVSRGWASASLFDFGFGCGKIDQGYIIESPIGSDGDVPGSFYYNNITSGTIVAYVSKIRSISTGQLFEPTTTIVTSRTETLTEQNIGTNPFYAPIPQKGDTAIVSNSVRSIDTKILLLEILNALRPDFDDPGQSYSSNSFPKVIDVSIWSSSDTDSVLTFRLKSNRSEIAICDVQATGAFVGATFAVYQTQDIYGFSLGITCTQAPTGSEYTISCSGYGVVFSTPVGGYIWTNEIPEGYTLVKNITPTPTITGTTVTTVDSVVIEDLGNGYIRMHGKLTEQTIAGDGLAQTPVVFPTGYTMANADYSIQLTGSSAEQTADVNVDFDTPATTGFNVDMKNLNATTAATNVVVHWTVFGKKATV